MASMPPPSFWASDLWRLGIAPAFPVFAALVAIAGAITAAWIQANGSVRSQLKAQQEITRRELARQARIDSAVRTQVASYLGTIAYGALFLIERPATTSSVSVLSSEIPRFRERARSVDVASACSVGEIRALEHAAVLMTNPAELELTAGSEDGQLTVEQRAAVVAWYAFTVGLVAARTAAVLGDERTLNVFREAADDTRMAELAMQLRAAVPSYPQSELEDDSEGRSTSNDAAVVGLYRAYDA